METQKLLSNLRMLCPINSREMVLKKVEDDSAVGVFEGLEPEWREIFWMIVAVAGFEADSRWFGDELRILSHSSNKIEAKRFVRGRTALYNIGRILCSLHTFPVIRDQLAMTVAWIVRREATDLIKRLDDVAVTGIAKRTFSRYLVTSKNAEKIHEAAPKKIGKSSIYPVFHYAAPFKVQTNACAQNKKNTVFCVVAKSPRDYLAPIFFEGDLLQFVKPDQEKNRWEKAAVRGSERIKGMLEKARRC